VFMNPLVLYPIESACKQFEAYKDNEMGNSSDEHQIGVKTGCFGVLQLVKHLKTCEQRNCCREQRDSMRIQLI
jgi:hypothetical protein